MHILQTLDGAEIIGFHWHPNGKGVGDNVRTPHTHMGLTQLNPKGVISKKHPIPGRRMSVEEVLRYCIEELQVEPMRPDWDPVLGDSEDLFRMWASWGVDKQLGPSPVSMGEAAGDALMRVMRSELPDEAKKTIILRLLLERQVDAPAMKAIADQFVVKAEAYLRDHSWHWLEE